MRFFFDKIYDNSRFRLGGKRSRQTYSKYQTAVLETVFHTSKYIVRSKRQQMSAELDLTERQIKIWFQNRRMKEKKCRKEVQRIDATNVPAAADDGVYAPAANYAPAGGGDDEDDDPMLLLLRDDTFPGYRGAGSKPALSSRRDNDASNYDLHLRPGPVVDSYDNACKVQQWPAHPVTAVDFHQDFYGDHVSIINRILSRVSARVRTIITLLPFRFSSTNPTVFKDSRRPPCTTTSVTHLTRK